MFVLASPIDPAARLPAHDGGFGHPQQLFSAFIIVIITSMMKGAQNLV